VSYCRQIHLTVLPNHAGLMSTLFGYLVRLAFLLSRILMGAPTVRCLLFATFLLPLTGTALAQTYALTDLGSGTASAINDAGVVAGANGKGAASIWTDGSEITLSTPGFKDALSAINDSAVTAGYSMNSSGKQALLWNGITIEHLTDSIATTDNATGINDASQVVGTITTDKNRNDERAVLWVDSKAVLLGTVSDYRNSVGTGINDSGMESGYVFSSAHSQKTWATVWNGTTPTLLGSLRNQSASQASALNNANQEAGFAVIGRNNVRDAVLWNGVTPQVLASLGGNASAADGINNAGAVVGYSTVAGSSRHEAVLWINGKVTNLNEYLNASQVQQGWYLQNATAINSSGTIVGVEENWLTGKKNAFELNIVSTVPEPAQYELLIAGIFLIVFLRVRRSASFK
jgi:probable HAF family extracellular repeat protein